MCPPGREGRDEVARVEKKAKGPGGRVCRFPYGCAGGKTGGPDYLLPAPGGKLAGTEDPALEQDLEADRFIPVLPAVWRVQPLAAGQGIFLGGFI